MRGRLGAVAVAGALVACLTAAPATVASARAQPPRTAKHCHRHGRKVCNTTPPTTTQSVSGTSGTLSVTFTATVTGSSVSFDIASTDSQSYGALGPEILNFGDGRSQGFATPDYCFADPMAESDDTTLSTTYPNAGSYTASVTVGANCTPDRLTLSLPLTIG